MNQQNKTKPEENQNKTAELSDKDLEQVAGGLAREESLLPGTTVNVDGLTDNHNETLVRDTGKVRGVKVKTNVKAGVSWGWDMKANVKV